MDSMWYFNPCFDTMDAAQRSHLKALPSTLFGENIGGGGLEGQGRHSLEASVLVWDSSFLLRKTSLLLALRRRVEGLDFFLTFSAGMATPLDSMEKMKLEPAVREREKVRPWLARVWHKARHCFAKEESPADASSIADILDEYLN